MKRIKVRRVCVVNMSHCDRSLISFKYINIVPLSAITPV